MSEEITTEEYYYDNGNLSSRVNYKDGERHGLYERWWPNGIPISKEYYFNDKEVTEEEFNKLSNPEKNNEEVREKYWSNGRLRFRYNYKNGKRHGLCEWWWVDGNLQSRFNFKNGKEHGLYEWWYENRNLQSRFNFKNGKRHGLCEWWYADGTLNHRGYYFNDKEITEKEFNKLSNPQKNNEEVKEEYWPNRNLRYRENYKDGEYHGLYEKWYENGNLEYRYNYKNGRRDGLCKEWYKDGTLKSKCNYKNGKRHGLYEWWYKNGNLEYREYYFNDKEVTEEEFNKLSNPQKNNEEVKEKYYDNGTLMSRINYKNGKRHGLYESWFKNGNLRFRGNFKNGEYHGLCEYWWKNGNLCTKEYYFNDKGVTEEEFNKLSNPQKNNEEVKEEYWPDRNLRYKENYKDGKWDGLCEWWSNGNLESREYYFNGKEVTEEEFNKLSNPQKNSEEVKEEYWPNGLIKYKYNMRNNLKHGLCEEWDECGNLWYSRYYYEGKVL